MIHDLIGIGFGPSNLGLAIAVEEHNRSRHGPAINAHFLEKQAGFGWHRGMLIDDATMQVSFLKDLVTLRNPGSDFSYLHYLQCRGRLIDFINHKTLFPLRVEFHDYLEWAADRLSTYASYGTEVIAVEPVWADRQVEHLQVLARQGEDLVSFRARNVVLALGLAPNLPPGVLPSDRTWHNLEMLPRTAELAGRPAAEQPKRLLVVGAGQSAAETVAYLHRSFPEAQVCSVFARYGYTPADDSPFANRIFDPAAVDLYYDAAPGVKQMLFDYHRNTNYSVVDMELIEQIYATVYREKVLGAERLRMLNASRVVQTRETADGVSVTVECLPTGELTELACDAVVYATGYRPADAGALLGSAASLCQRDDEGNLRLGRDYRVVTDPRVSAGIYLQGGTEHSHGITSTLLSNTAVRAGEIVQAVLAARATPGTAVISDAGVSAVSHGR